MAVTSTTYRSGPIWTMSGSSGDFGTGGELLKHNFEQLYDLINPSATSGGTLSEVPVVCGGLSSAHKALTFALPSITGLTSGSDYIAVYTKNGSTTWRSYTSSISAAQQTGTGATSELVRPSSAYRTDWFNSGDPSNMYWMSATSNGPALQKTYKTVIDGDSAIVNLPSFGSWFVTGTIVFIKDDPTGSNQAESHLVRVNIYGRDATVFNTIIEAFSIPTNSSVGSWTQTNMVSAYENNSQLYIVDAGASTVIMDLTVIGGFRGHEASGLILTSSTLSA